MPGKVKIYTKDCCIYCQRAKDLLRIKGIPFVEHDITDEALMGGEIQPHGQQRVAPRIFINDALIGGCTELFDLDERGELDALLGLASPAAGAVH